MAYTTINKSTEHFNTLAYTGTGVNPTTFTGVGFQPDFCWFKARNFADPHQLYDSVRGVHKYVRSNENSAEGDDDGSLQAFTSDGFTLGNSGNVNGGTNQNLVAWNWKANGAGSANTDGDISSTVSANTTSGFSIVNWTANGSNNATIGHGLSSTPKIVLYKKLNDVDSWYAVYTFVDGTQDYVVLNDTNAKADLASGTYGTATSTTISNIGFPNSSSLIAYCFADVQGYSKFGKFIGNGNADGTFVYTGFKPAFVMIKMTSEAQNWGIYDNKRVGYNEVKNVLFPNLSNAENTDLAPIDLLSNGFKMRRNASASDQNNKSGGTYIYMAFAEAPLVGTNNVPCTAR